MRECREETSLHIHALDSQITYLMDGEDIKSLKRKKLKQEGIPAPIFVRAGNNEFSIMYLSYGMGTLKPDMETQGILLMRKCEIQRIAMQATTLGEYIHAGGRAMFARPLPDDALLTPGVQLRFLNELLSLEPDLMDDYMRNEPQRKW